MLSDCGGALNYGAYLQQDRVGSKMEFRVRRGRTLCLAIFLVSLLVCYAIIPYNEPPAANKKGRDNLERCVYLVSLIVYTLIYQNSLAKGSHI